MGSEQVNLGVFDEPNCLDPHIKADTETIRKSLEGNWRPEHLFTLGQSRDLYRIYQQQIVNCDLEIEKMLQGFAPRIDHGERPLPPDRKRNRAGSKRRRKNGHPHPEFDLLSDKSGLRFILKSPSVPFLPCRVRHTAAGTKGRLLRNRVSALPAGFHCALGSVVRYILQERAGNPNYN